MRTDRAGLQLEFDLKLDEVTGDAAERSISPEQARLISEAAREQLQDRYGDRSGSGKKPGWLEDYEMLLLRGWPWRVACYIAWASSPKLYREPRTVGELATQVLGLTSPRVIYQWRKEYRHIDTVIGMLQGAVLWEHRRDVLEALAEMAARPDYKAHNDRRIFLEMTGDYKPENKVNLADADGRPLLPVNELIAALRKAEGAQEEGKEGTRIDADQKPISADQKPIRADQAGDAGDDGAAG